jgi:CRISPR-associated protein Cmr6
VHPGLWLDRYLYDQPVSDNDTSSSLHEHFAKVASLTVAHGYSQFFERWKQQLANTGASAKTATVRGRMVTGIGAESVLENSITLHRTWGTPFIPGSALKGLAASYARRRLVDPAWGKTGEAYLYVFGDMTANGAVTFFDAHYVPESLGAQPLVRDVLTVHHRDYYQTGTAAPADWDDPIPIPFLSTTGKYLLALQGPNEWVAVVWRILSRALDEEGIGAKTNAGYGRMEIDEVVVETPKELNSLQARLQTDVNRFLDSIKAEGARLNGQSILSSWKQLDIKLKIHRDARVYVAYTVRKVLIDADIAKQLANNFSYQEMKELALLYQPGNV